MIAAIMVAAGLLAVAVAAVVRRAVAADDPGRGIVVATAEPPADLDLWTAANLMGLPRAALGASVLDLASRGGLHLLEVDDRGRRGLGARRSGTTLFTRDDLELVEALFPRRGAVADQPAPVVRFEGQLAGRRHLVLDRYVLDRADRAARAAIATGLRRGASAPLIAASVGAMAVAMSAGAIGILEAESGPILMTLGTALLAMACGGASVLALIVSIRHRPLTGKGRAVRDHLLGLRRYLEVAEADRLRSLDDVLTADREPTAGGGVVLRTRRTLMPWALVTGIPVEWARIFDYGRRRDDL